MPTTPPSNELGIRCPGCGARHVPEDPLFVTNTYSLSAPNAIKRIRECPYCTKRFKTVEQIVVEGIGK